MATYCWWAANSCAICSSSLATNASAGIAPAYPDARLGSPNMGRRGGEGDQTEEALLQGPPALQALPGRPQAPRGAGARGQGRRALHRRRRGEEEAAQGRSPLSPPARALAPRSPSGRPFAHHLAGALVLAQPEEARLAHAAGGGPLREADLRDELRADPVHPRGARLDRLLRTGGRELRAG